MSEGAALILGVLLTAGLIVGIGIAVLYTVGILFDVRQGRPSETDTPPPAKAGHSWSVRLPDGQHSVEVRDDLNYPLLVYCDRVAIPLDWHRGYATFSISGHDGRLSPGFDWRPKALVSALVRGGLPTSFDLTVAGGDVESWRDQGGVLS